MAKSTNHHLAVAAIDFGTTFSGLAYSFRHTYENAPTNVFAKNWNNGDNISTKVPTCLLVKPDGKTLEAFGYQAENMYADMETEEDRQRYFYFRQFKMSLYQQGVSRDMKLEAVNGKSLPAILVFQLALEFLKNDLIAECSSKVPGELRVRDIHWCLTVPAIWNDKAKKFMREAAIKAGINSFDLTIVLEPEAASAFCRHLPVDMLEGGSLESMGPGSTYMVIDCGGGTTDICCHKILDDGKLKEIHRASGGAVGGTDVDAAFESFLKKLFGPKVWEEFTRENMDDFFSLFRCFEVKKRELSGGSGGWTTFALPNELVDILRTKAKQDVLSAASKAGFQNVIKVLKGNKVKINSDFLKTETFDDVANRLRDLLLEVCKSPMLGETKVVLLVGGLSESRVIRDAVKETLPDKQVITIQEASLAVVKGAVIYGHDVSVMKSRIARYTYGEGISFLFDPTIDHEDKAQISINGSKRVSVFQSIVTAGEEMAASHVVTKRGRQPVNENQTLISCEIYAVDAEHRIPVYISDPRCIHMGKVSAPITNTTIPATENTFSFQFKFGGTEISATVTEISNQNTTEGSFDFLG